MYKTFGHKTRDDFDNKKKLGNNGMFSFEYFNNHILSQS